MSDTRPPEALREALERLDFDTDRDREMVRAALASTPEPDLTRTLWEIAILTGMDTDGDTGPGAMIAGMGVAGFARAIVEEVRRLRESYDECLAEPDLDVERLARAYGIVTFGTNHLTDARLAVAEEITAEYARLRDSNA